MAVKKKAGKRRAIRTKKVAKKGKSRLRAVLLKAIIEATGLSLEDVREELMLLARSPVRKPKKKRRK